MEDEISEEAGLKVMKHWRIDKMPKDSNDLILPMDFAGIIEM